MHNKQVIIFEGSGFLGRYITRLLSQEGFRVRVATRNVAATEFLRVSGDVGQILPLEVDYSKEDSIFQASDGVDYVINLTGILSENFYSFKSGFHEVHCVLAKKISKVCDQLSVKSLIHFSAIGAEHNSKSKYARTKWLGEQTALGIFSRTTIIRPSVIFGPEDQFFNKFATMLKLFPIFPILGCNFKVFLKECFFKNKINLLKLRGIRFQPVYVGDVARAVNKIWINTNKYEGKIIHLGGPTVYTFREILQLILTELSFKRYLAPIPISLSKILGFFLGLLPNPALTLDQVRLLEKDNVVGKNVLSFSDLAIKPKSAEIILPTYLKR